MSYLYEVRVIFGDTDQMGVVYYANYLRYFEGGRAGLLRHLGWTQKDLAALDVALPVVEVHCQYRRPAHYEDLLSIKVEITELHGASMRFAYEVLRDGELLAEGNTLHACVGSRGRPKRLPKELLTLIESRPRD